MKKKILIAISSLGLGHATRTSAIINELLKNDNNKITILSFGNTLSFLKNEFKDRVEYIEREDYPKFGRGGSFSQYPYLILDILKVNFLVKKEKKFIKKIENEFDFIFSDGKYGIVSKKIPSVILSHQVIFENPFFFKPFSFFSQYGNYRYLKEFDNLLIPDYNVKNNLAGKLSRNWVSKKLNAIYLGILSSYKKNIDTKKDINMLFLISGYLKKNRNSFINTLVEEAKKIDGKKVFALGDMSSDNVVFDKENNIEIYNFIAGERKNDFFNRAKTIVSRSGYTTILDLVEFDKKAILFPTPNQTEQEYLSEYYKKNNFFTIGDEKNVDLKKLLEKTKENYYDFPDKTKESIKKFNKIFNNYVKDNFISIIIPAYNEEKEIEKILNSVTDQKYENYEIIVVENGSTDRTWEILQKYKENEKIKIFKNPEKGVSKARNFGLNKVSKESKWTVFLDADTLLGDNFLVELNRFLNKKSNKDSVIGTVEIYPIENISKYGKCWYDFYNFGHKTTKTSYSIQIAKTDIAKEVKYNEEFSFSEDLVFLKDMRKKGKFFFLETKQVKTSARRFLEDGYLKTFLIWNYQAILPRFLKKKKKYKPIR